MREPSRELLQRNLAAIAVRSPDAARRIAAATPRDDLTLVETREDAPGGMLGVGESARALASRHRPLEEAARLAARIDPRAHGAVAVSGFGLGHHVSAIAQRLGEHGVVIVFEPDAGLLRAVLERIDCAAWIRSTHLVLALDEDDAPGLSASLERLGALISIGLELVTHPASEARLGDRAQVFERTVAGVVRTLRTTIATTLVQSPTTLRNLLMNLDHYATRPGPGSSA